MLNSKKLYKDIPLKDGTILMKGSLVSVEPVNYRACKITFPSGESHQVRYTSVFKPPSMKCLNEWLMDEGCETIIGNTVEPDGYDDQGFPSWLLALGLI
jgi:hypothetical protein